MRKRRYWFCAKCGVIYHRRKGEDDQTCGRCHKPMVAARKYTKRMAVAQRARLRRVARQQIAQQKAIERYSVPRTTFGTRFRFSGATKRAWRRLLASPHHRSSWKSRGQAFLKEASLDIWTCPHRRRVLGLMTERGCHCHGGGSLGAPKLKVEKPKSIDCGATFGVYTTGFDRHSGSFHYDIRIDWGGEHPLQTLVHEVQHWMDSMVHIGRATQILTDHPIAGTHTKAFFRRLDDLLAQLDYSSEDEWKTATATTSAT
jgi:hypothetical protein